MKKNQNTQQVTQHRERERVNISDLKQTSFLLWLHFQSCLMMAWALAEFASLNVVCSQKKLTTVLPIFTISEVKILTCYIFHSAYQFYKWYGRRCRGDSDGQGKDEENTVTFSAFTNGGFQTDEKIPIGPSHIEDKLKNGFLKRGLPAEEKPPREVLDAGTNL